MLEHISIPEERMKLLKKSSDWKEKLSKFLDVGIELNEEIVIEGDTLQVMRAKEIMKAFGRGFSFEDALNLLDESYYLEVIDVKQFTGKSKSRQTILKGRVIGEEGRMKKMIEKAADVKIAIYGKTVGIIGKYQNVKIASEAVGMLLSGSKHSNVYRFLNENKVV